MVGLTFSSSGYTTHGSAATATCVGIHLILTTSQLQPSFSSLDCIVSDNAPPCSLLINYRAAEHRLLHSDFSALLLMLLCLWHNDLEDSILYLRLDVLWVSLQAEHNLISPGACMCQMSLT